MYTSPSSFTIFFRLINHEINLSMSKLLAKVVRQNYEIKKVPPNANHNQIIGRKFKIKNGHNTEKGKF